MCRSALLAAAAVACVAAPLAAAQPAVITVHADVALASAAKGMIGVGIEDVNHELVGGIYTQQVFGESFEEPSGQDGVSGSTGRLTWTPGSSAAACIFKVVSGGAWTGSQSQGVSVPAAGACTLVNRGLDYAGMSFAAGQGYSGYAYVSVPASSAGPVQLTFSLVDDRSDGSGPVMLASSSFAVPQLAAWTAYPFSLTPNGSTTCYQDPNPEVPCSPNAEGLCWTCTGELWVTVSAPPSTGLGGYAQLDQVFLAPVGGRQGPYVPGLPARADVVTALTQGSGLTTMGLTAMRLGGSAILVDGYKWKRFRGPQASREPYTGWWYPQASSGWGIFEFLQVCEAAPGLHTCVVTMNSGETLQDVADFLEYVYGSASNSTWGAQRAADGHAAPYQPFWIEIGNEQNHTDPSYIAQVTSFVDTLNSTAARLALAFRLQIVIGAIWIPWPPAQAVPMATALAPYTPHQDIHWDFHVGGDNPSSDPVEAFSFLAQVRDVLSNVSAQAGTPPILGAVLEENGSLHSMRRALGHARMSNRMHCLADFVRVDTAANGLQVAGRNDNSWDQGQVFITQGGVYLSPAGWAQAVLSQSAAGAGDVVVAVDAAGLDAYPQLDVVALRDAAGTQVGVRVVNLSPAPTPVSIVWQGCSVGSGSSPLASLAYLVGNLTAQNLPTDPAAIAPSFTTIQVNTNGPVPFLNLSLAPWSFTTVNLPCTAGTGAAGVETVEEWEREQRRLRARGATTNSNTKPVSSGTTAGSGAATAATTATSTTCDLPDPAAVPTFTWAGHTWGYYNRGPWAVVGPGHGAAGIDASSSSLALYCNPSSLDCYDQAVALDAALPTTGSSWASVDVTLPAQPNGSSIQDAGLLVRVVPDGIGPGMDTFNGYEVSVGGNTGGPGSGLVLLGAHWLPGSFSSLKQVPWDVRPGVTHTIAANMTVAADGSTVAFTVSVDGVTALTYSDSTYVGRINGGHVAVRSFYSDVVWSNLQAGPWGPGQA